MRLWHKDLIKVLPRQQLLSQWRECCCIARNIAVNGTPNHLLVNKVLDYPLAHFVAYTELVQNEMTNRGYKTDANKFYGWIAATNYISQYIDSQSIFKDWHNDRYFNQCFYNLQEKFDCGGIPIDEWERIDQFRRLRQIVKSSNAYE